MYSVMYMLLHLQAFRAQNVESAKARLSLCAVDIREELEESSNKPELCSQLGAVLGVLGDCWYNLSLFLSHKASLCAAQTLNWISNPWFIIRRACLFWHLSCLYYTRVSQDIYCEAGDINLDVLMKLMVL